MPRALKVCPCIGCAAHEGTCPELVQTGRCPRCTTAAEQRRGTARQRGYDARWQRTQAAHLRKHPLCVEPGCLRPATDVDHIDGLGPLGPRGHDPGNLRSYCHSHHSKRTAVDQPGGWHAR